MSKNVLKNDLIKERMKKAFLTMKVPTLYSNYKNFVTSNKKSFPSEIKYRTMNSVSINSSKNLNKNKLIIPKLVKKINIEKGKKKYEKLKNFQPFKLKTLSNHFINSNYFDINNNNYFVNLYSSSTPKYSKTIDISKTFKSKENKNFVNKMKYSLNKLKKRIKLNFKTSSSEERRASLKIIPSYETDKKMRNYRNKLLLEFIKHLKKFIIFYQKKNFAFLRKKIFHTQKEKVIVSYIYKKPRKEIMRSHFAGVSSQRLNSRNIIKKENMKYSNLLKINDKILVNKNNNFLKKAVLLEENRNQFFSSDFSIKDSFHKDEENINRSYNEKRSKINMDYPEKPNVTEIEINFKQIKKKKLRNIISQNKRKINLRFNHMIYKWNKKKKFFINISIQKQLDSFTLKSKNDIPQTSKIKKMFKYNNIRNETLPSIMEVDEKYFGSV